MPDIKDDRFASIAKKLRSWNELTDSVELPPDLYAVLMTGRPELLKIAEPRALSEEECAKLYKLLGVLIETNSALKLHSKLLAQHAENMSQQLKGVVGLTRALENFAAFRHGDDDAGT